jgi:PIN domain nuclease of toxin-antitoxin system
VKYLLDTHILLWYLTNDNLLDFSKMELISYNLNSTFISSVSLWEITIKCSKGKLYFEGFTLKDLLF